MKKGLVISLIAGGLILILLIVMIPGRYFYRINKRRKAELAQAQEDLPRFRDQTERLRTEFNLREDELLQDLQDSLIAPRVTANLGQLFTQTDDVVDFIEQCQYKLEEMGKLDAVTGELMEPEEREWNYRFWMFPEPGSGSQANDLANGGRGSGKAYELTQILDKYVYDLNDSLEALAAAGLIVPPQDEFQSPTAIDPDPEWMGPTWEYKTFHDKAIFIDLATLEGIKAHIMEIRKSSVEMMVATPAVPTSLEP